MNTQPNKSELTETVTPKRKADVHYRIGLWIMFFLLVVLLIHDFELHTRMDSAEKEINGLIPTTLRFTPKRINENQTEKQSRVLR